MANEQNLQTDKYKIKTSEEAQIKGRAGGIASGKSKKEKKLFKEALEEQLGKTVDDMVLSMIQQVIKKGNVNAFNSLVGLNGEKIEQVNISGNIGESINKLDELMKDERKPKERS